MSRPQRVQHADVPGLAARRIALDILDGVLRRHRPLDEHFDGERVHLGLAALADRDRALVRKLVAAVLRRLGTLRGLLAAALDRGIPDDAPRIETMLFIGAAQILWLDVPDHAAVDLAVRLAQADRRAARYAGLVNAVLRRRRARGRAPTLGRTPAARHAALAGGALERALRRGHRPRDRRRRIANEPPLDLTVKDAPTLGRAARGPRAADRHGARSSRTGRCASCPATPRAHGGCRTPPPPCRRACCGDVRGKRVADLCAAPGGKTAQLAAAGAQVTAVDRSAARLKRLRQNLARLELAAETSRPTHANGRRAVRRGAARRPVLVDRHDPPPSGHSLAQARGGHRGARGAAAPAARRARSSSSRPGGTLVYCTCSLEPEEGRDAVAALLGARALASGVGRCRRKRSPAGRGSVRRRAICARCPASCPNPIPTWRARRLLCGPVEKL